MSRAKAREVLAGHDVPDELGADAAVQLLTDRVEALEGTIATLTAIIREIAPARFGAAKTPDAMLKEIGG